MHNHIESIEFAMITVTMSSGFLYKLVGEMRLICSKTVCAQRFSS